MHFQRMIMEKESPEELGYDKIRYNLSESSIADRRLSDIGVSPADLLLFYGDHKGDPSLRELLARDHYGLDPLKVLITSGACMGIFIVNATLLSPGDKMVVVHPNYAVNIEAPKSLAVDVDLFRLKFDENFGLDPQALEARIDSRTKLISITYPHNPSGAVLDKSALLKLVEIAERHGCWLLVDETYRELSFCEPPPPAATLSPNAISVESISKAYGVPGIRIGWIANQDSALMERFLATKEQILICNSVLDEHIALEVLSRKKELMRQTRTVIDGNFLKLKRWMSEQEHLEWVEPSGGVVCFPRFKKDAPVNIARFYAILEKEHAAMVGRGGWFDEDDRYFRIGYGWPSPKELSGGLNAITEAAKRATL